MQAVEPEEGLEPGDQVGLPEPDLLRTDALAAVAVGEVDRLDVSFWHPGGEEGDDRFPEPRGIEVEVGGRRGLRRHSGSHLGRTIREGGVARPRREALQVADQVMALRAVETDPVFDLGHADGRGLGSLPDVHADEDGRRHLTVTEAGAPPSA
jgi:hypothetical protein